MRKIIITALLLVGLFASPLFARGKIQGYVEQGGNSISVAGFSSTTKAQVSYPGATVTVYTANTVTLSTIYSDNIGTSKANPFTASSTGLYSLWTDDSSVDLVFSGTGITTPFTITAVQPTTQTNLSTINVSDYATAGAGTLASPWTGWDTAIAWAGPVGTGTISVPNGTSPETVTGVGTSFTTQFSVGGFISSGGGAGQITAIANNTSLTVSQWLASTKVAAAFTIYTPKSYHFASGVYAYATSPMFGLPYMHVWGDGLSTVFKHTGAGVCFNVSPSLTGVGAGAFGASFEGFLIQGNGQPIGLAVGNMNHVSFRDILVQGVATTGIFAANIVGSTWVNVRVSGGEGFPNTPAPITGWIINAVSLMDMYGCISEGNTTGVSIVSSTYVNWSGGTIEGNSGVGLIIDSGSLNNIFTSVDLESNTTADAQVNGYFNSFININSADSFQINPGAGLGNNNTLINGQYTSIVIFANAKRNILFGLAFSVSLTDNGINTSRISVTNNATALFEPTTIPEHLHFIGVAAPTIGAASGSTGATMAFDAGSTDTAGTITVTQTNVAPAATGSVIGTYSNAYPGGTVPKLLVTLVYGGNAWANGATCVIQTSTNTGFQIAFTNAAVNFSAGTYKISYLVLQ